MFVELRVCIFVAHVGLKRICMLLLLSSAFKASTKKSFRIKIHFEIIVIYVFCFVFFSGETLPLATSNQIMLRFNAKSGQSARGFHFVYQGNSHCVWHVFTITYVQVKINFKVSLLIFLFPVFPHLELFNYCHYCSCASDQWQPVQFSTWASVWQEDWFRVLSGLCGSVWVQSRISIKGIQCDSVPGGTRCPRTVEHNNTNLYR